MSSTSKHAFRLIVALSLGNLATSCDSATGDDLPHPAESGTSNAPTAGTAASPAGSGGMGGSSSMAGSSGTPAAGGTEPSVSGGAESTGGSVATGGVGEGSAFTLAWQDDFDTLDASRWALQTFSWDGNLAQFTPANASVADGILAIALTPEPSDAAKPYRGVELRSIPTLTYGKIEARVRFASGSGVVSGLVLIYTPWPADDWNEIDIEHLGKTPEGVQLNCQVYTGPPTSPPVTQSVSPTQDSLVSTLAFDAEADFHLYAIEWTPAQVIFLADGAILHTWSGEIDRMRLPQNILFTIWASSATSWAGEITADSAPTTAEIDWIKVYSLDR